MLILVSNTEIMYRQCALHLPVLPPYPYLLLAQALTLTLTATPQILLLIAVILDLKLLVCQIFHLTLSCSSNRKPWWSCTPPPFFFAMGCS